MAQVVDGGVRRDPVEGVFESSFQVFDSPRLRISFLIFEKTCSMGFKSRKDGGRNRKRAS